MKLSKTLLDNIETFSNVEFLKEWTPKDFYKMNKALLNYFRYKRFITHTGKVTMGGMNHIEEVLGLPYTSSSDYAGKRVTNTEIYHRTIDGYKYIGFSIGVDGNCYAVLWDKDENEKIILI